MPQNDPTSSHMCRVILCLLPLAGVGVASTSFAGGDDPSNTELIRTAVTQLLSMQESDGTWPYEGVYRVRGKIPIGYRIGGTALVGEALLHSTPRDDKKVFSAIARGIDYILAALEDPRMAPSKKNAYDVRVWGHCYALEFFCQLRGSKRFADHDKSIQKWIPKLVDALIAEELPGGGWNYANRRQHAAFVTAPVTQALLLARSQGEKVPAEVFERSRKILLGSRVDTGAFTYSGRSAGQAESPRAKMPGSIGRSPLCETTLTLLGGGSNRAIQAALDAFHLHWDELEKRRKKTGTHAGPYGIAPYYFYFAHRYAAQAIQALPPADRAAERQRMRDVLLRTRDEDGTWNDRVFKRSRNFGSAMAVLALLGDRTPLPPPLDSRP